MDLYDIIVYGRLESYVDVKIYSVSICFDLRNTQAIRIKSQTKHKNYGPLYKTISDVVEK